MLSKKSDGSISTKMFYTLLLKMTETPVPMWSIAISKFDCDAVQQCFLVRLCVVFVVVFF